MRKQAWLAAVIAAASARAFASTEKMPMKSAPPAVVPAAIAAKFVTIKKADDWDKGGVTVMTQAVAVKEAGPKETVARFGELYAFSPSFIAVRRERPALIRFLNLQPDDEHDFSLLGPGGEVLFYFKLPPLGEAEYVFTFHQEGSFDFKCPIHAPHMGGQILVLPRESKK
jgi:plastocyanin